MGWAERYMLDKRKKVTTILWWQRLPRLGTFSATKDKMPISISFLLRATTIPVYIQRLPHCLRWQATRSGELLCTVPRSNAGSPSSYNQLLRRVLIFE